MWSWQERPVDRTQPHLKLKHDEHDSPVAVVGRPEGEVFPVQFLVDAGDAELAEVTADTARSLDNYLVELGEPDPWIYAIYHAGTTSNFYARVHWTYVDPAQTTTRS